MVCWRQVANTVFDNLPVAALVENAVFCVHGGIGKTLKSLDQIRCDPLTYPAVPALLWAFLSLRRCICLSASLPLCLAVSLSFCLFVPLSLCLSVSLFLIWFICFPCGPHG